VEDMENQEVHPKTGVKKEEEEKEEEIKVRWF
jgi:hypothetical protein